MNTPAAPTDPNLVKKLRNTTLVGLALMATFVVIFGDWLANAPLSSAAVATGVVSPDGSRRSVQHLEGGIVRKILVKDGDKVEAGQKLLLLEETQAKAQHSGNYKNWLRNRAFLARIEALMAYNKKVVFPEDILSHAKTDPDFTHFIDNQTKQFKDRSARHKGEKDALKQRIEQTKEKIKADESEYKNNNEQLTHTESELSDITQLYYSGDAKKSRLLQLKRAASEIRAKIAASRASIASTKIEVTKTEIEILNLEKTYQDELNDQYMRLNTQLAQLEESMTATSDVLKRTAIVAPVSGTVVNLVFKTSGGVIRPGDVILELVPSEERLVIDARVQPIDINAIKVGQRAQVHLLPFEQRHMPIINGDVVSISADSITDDRTGERYFKAKVVIPNDRLASIAPGVKLAPGMPADVMIITGERSALRYILEPVERSLRRSFRQG